MKKVRFGTVGVGGMGGVHASLIAGAGSRQFCLAAVADIVPEIARRVGEQYGVPYFNDAQEMYDSGLIDAATIAAPHYWHPPLAIRAARAGLHVLSEKPLAAAVGPARAMVAECKKRKVALGVMLQQRTRTIMKKIKQMIAAGRLGEVFHVSMLCSNWYRTQAYYDSGSWRGTWDGEGGGILLNQAPHSLDLFQWLGGMPERITAVVSTRGHKIEVENTACAICEYGGGKIGYIYATTAELPGAERFAIAGDKATLLCENDKLMLGKLKMPITRHLATCTKTWDSIPCQWREVPLPGDPGGGHINVIRAFVSHVLKGAPMVATGAEALGELEISNAVYLSAHNRKSIDLPVDAGQMDRLLASLERRLSTGKGGGLRAKATRDLKNLLASGGRRRKTK